MLQHDFVADQRLAGPNGAGQGEHPMFDRVPLGGSCGIMSDSDSQAEFVGQVLQAQLPSPTTVAIGASAVGFDGQPRGPRILAAADPQPPRTDGTYCKSCRLMRGADHDVACVAILVIDAIGEGAAPGQRGKVVVQHVAVFTSPSTPTILEVAPQLLFLRVHADCGAILPLKS